ncbi:DUF433 domain-containing protein [Desulfonema magnum]|uniref:DUF433 domain-containing protein n=1 Tax=Desulfonema magnum TaxID=45655 RepID=A0A975BS21_9BACT|nr:DUF433 domain-containing protein [Desulfonema magnum]QTA90631.1 Uncharacterized protein dnm_066920 [Desulfonema magnum]
MGKSIYRPTIVRTERGLTIGGTRLTLYMIMEFLKTGYSWDEIQDEFRLTFRQTDEIREFLETHREEAEKEYEQVTALAESNRRYWEERNRERFRQIAEKQPEPERLELWRKLQEWKKRLAQQELQY